MRRSQGGGSIDSAAYKKTTTIKHIDIGGGAGGESTRKQIKLVEINREAAFLPALRSNFRRSPTKSITFEKKASTVKKFLQQPKTGGMRSPDHSFNLQLSTPKTGGERFLLATSPCEEADEFEEGVIESTT